MAIVFNICEKLVNVSSISLYIINVYYYISCNNKEFVSKVVDHSHKILRKSIRIVLVLSSKVFLC